MTEIRLILVLSALAIAAGCAPESTDTPTQSDARAIPPEQQALPVAEQAAGSELAGTAWRLVNITSMDDTVHVPADPSSYTLQFGTDGDAGMQADCNRGTGSWASESPGQLVFSPIAATRAMCPPGSLSEEYLAQFEWVRSYVMRDGHLYLSTMADGSIIEFEPLPAVVATVLGRDIRNQDPRAVQEAILMRLLDRYAAEHDLSADEAEITAWLEAMNRGMAAEGLTAADDLTPEEVVEVEAMRREMGRSLIGQWKINRSLYETYGGRIIYQQLGPEPLDAYRQYLEERHAAGDFTIRDPAMKDAFWRYFKDDSLHDFMDKGSAVEAAAFARPPWEALADDA